MATYNVSGITNTSVIKNAIDTYRSLLKGATDVYASNSEIRRAIRGGNVENQLKALTMVINNKAMALYNEFTAFRDKVTEMESKYKGQDNSAKAISNVTSAIKKS